jgi:chromosome segregation ATPase
MDLKEAAAAEEEEIEAEAEAEAEEAEAQETEAETEEETEAEPEEETEAELETEAEAAQEAEETEAAAEAAAESEEEETREGDTKETEDSDARGRMAKVEENANQHNHVIEVLQDKITQLSTYFELLRGEVSIFRSAAAGIQTPSEEFSALKTQIGQNMNNPVVEQLSTDLKELRKEFLIQKAEIAAMSRTVTPSSPFRCSIRESFLMFRRSSQSSQKSSFYFCGGVVAMV